MGRLTIGQKATRVVYFLLGLRNARTAAYLKPYGFTEADLQEGWIFLRAVGKSQLDSEPEGPDYDPETLITLDRWENKWFPIADATLQRHAPAVHRWLFKNLSQTEGAAVVVSVGTFVERFDNLDKPESEGGPKSGGKAAKKKLVERGMTKPVLDEARTLLGRLGAISGPLPDLPDLAAAAAQVAQAEKDMWAWYLEWSRIARRVITQRSLLRQLGFLRTTSAGVTEEVEIDEEETADEGEGGEVEAAEPAKAKKGTEPA